MTPSKSGISRNGIPCTVVATGKDSETSATVVIYTTTAGSYWVMPLSSFEVEPLAPEAPEPIFMVSLGNFRHFKGTTYSVVVRARDPWTLKNQIVYQSPTGDLWVRPESMFLEEVEWADGVRRARFVSTES